jgi:DNA polymerase III alpha subunit
LAKDDEDKLALYMKDCSMENIKVFSPSINHSSIDTVVDEYGNIHLPLTILKGVGEKVSEVCGYQPFADLTDFAYRAKPNRTIVKGLAMGNALDCLLKGLKFEHTEEFLEYWDEIVAKKNAEEKQRLKDEKRMSMADSPIEIVKSDAPPTRTRTTRSVTKRITGLSKNLLDDDFFN